MQEARIELLQRMPIFGGVRADTLQFLLAARSRRSPRRSKSWHGKDYFLQTLLVRLTVMDID
jgi:hypothetical protein